MPAAQEELTTENFPPMQHSNLLNAARGLPTTQIPVWVMRQAGRYLPEFREFRRHHGFFEICREPRFATEVTMQPLRRFRLDASIIFSDILVIPQALGLEVQMHPGVGPVFPQPLQTPECLARLNPDGAIDRLRYVGAAITLMRHRLGGRVPLIGFSGAPWTLMGYMIEGGGSKTMSRTKEWLAKYPEASERLLELLTRLVVEYFVMQVRAGAQMLQLFESSAEHLDPDHEYGRYSLQWCARIRNEVNAKLVEQGLETVPFCMFAKGGAHSLKRQADAGFEVIGVDYSVTAAEARAAVGPNVTLQGNLHPMDLYKPEPELRRLITDMVKGFGTQRYIANLGHGITPETPISGMQTLIDVVHSFDSEEIVSVAVDEYFEKEGKEYMLEAMRPKEGDEKKEEESKQEPEQ